MPKSAEYEDHKYDPEAFRNMDWRVEVIRWAKFGEKDGKRQWLYRVQWCGQWMKDGRTWQTEEDLADCKGMLEEFWNEVGQELRGQRRKGFQARPSNAWIEHTIRKTAHYFDGQSLCVERQDALPKIRIPARIHSQTPQVEYQTISNREAYTYLPASPTSSISTIESLFGDSDDGNHDDKSLTGDGDAPFVFKLTALDSICKTVQEYRNESSEIQTPQFVEPIFEPLGGDFSVWPTETDLTYRKEMSPECPPSPPATNGSVLNFINISQTSLDNSQDWEIVQSPSIGAEMELDNFIDWDATIDTTMDTISDTVEAQLMTQLVASTPASSQPEHVWSGALQLDQSRERNLCQATVHQVSTVRAGISFAEALQDIKEFPVFNQYDDDDITAILPAFGSPTQLGMLSPQGEQDAEPFAIMHRYMGKKKQTIVLLPPFKSEAFMILLFEPVSILAEDLSVPEELCIGTHLVAAILPTSQVLSSSIASSTSRQIWRSDARILDATEWLFGRISIIKQAITTFCLTQHELDKLQKAASGCSIFIWSNAATQYEAVLMRALFEHFGAKCTSETAKANRIFIHRRALRTFHLLPDLERLRMKQQAAFTLFGLPIPVRLHEPRFEAVYGSGGLVTFTPLAMFVDPVTVISKIEEISRNPFWQAYILPTTLAILLELECGSQDPIQEFENGRLATSLYLGVIERGTLCLLEAPRELGTARSYTERHTWMAMFKAFRTPSQRESIEIALRASKPETEASLPAQIKAQDDLILQDMILMQRNTSMAAHFRRFIVIDSERSARGQISNNFGVEWTTSNELVIPSYESSSAKTTTRREEEKRGLIGTAVVEVIDQ